MTNRIFATVLAALMFAFMAPAGQARESRAAARVSESVGLLREMAHPLTGAEDLGPLLVRVGEARLVLLGEASHGTSEFYTWRTKISRRLIEEKEFKFIAVEGDWATCYELNRYVKGLPGAGADARKIMQGFDRWPTWMWSNEETLELIEWLRAYNLQRPPHQRVGFYGIDVYGEARSRVQAVALLEAWDKDLAEKVREAYRCFEPHGFDLGRYARALMRGAPSCEQEVRRAYRLILEHAARHRDQNPDEFLNIQQNARVVQNAERHHRTMAFTGPESWNSRADHFFDTVDHLLQFYGGEARGIVWAHNTHIGDARATPMAQAGQRNIGQIARERLGPEQVVAVGFGTHRGTVKAGRSWGAPQERMIVPNAQPDSFEDLKQQMGLRKALIIFDRQKDLSPLLEVRGHRAIGVVYDPAREHQGNYVPTILPARYDAFVFIEETRALKPITP